MANLYGVFGLTFKGSGVASHLALDEEDTVRMLSEFARTLPGLCIPKVVQCLCIFF